MAELTDVPSSEDWQLAVISLKLIEDLDGEAFRDELRKLARALECEGLAAHRSADRLEQRSVFTAPVSPSDHAATAIWARVSPWYTDRHWVLVGSYISRLGTVNLDDPGTLRQQAATILDAAQVLDEIVVWYEARRASIGTRDLTNDTIVAIMIDWNTPPTETARQLTAHGHAVTDAAVKMALLRHRERSEAGVGNEGPQPMRVLLRRR